MKHLCRLGASNIYWIFLFMYNSKFSLQSEHSNMTFQEKKKSFLRKVFYWKLNCCVDEFIFHDLMSHSGIVSPKRLYNHKVSTVYWNTMIKKNICLNVASCIRWNWRKVEISMFVLIWGVIWILRKSQINFRFSLTSNMKQKRNSILCPFWC